MGVCVNGALVWGRFQFGMNFLAHQGSPDPNPCWDLAIPGEHLLVIILLNKNALVSATDSQRSNPLGTNATQWYAISYDERYVSGAMHWLDVAHNFRSLSGQCVALDRNLYFPISMFRPSSE